MAVSARDKGKGKMDDGDDGRKSAWDKGKKAVLDKGKSIVRDDDEEEDTENEEYVADEAEEGGAWDSSGEDIKVTRKKRHKRYKDLSDLDEDDYDLLEEANVPGVRRPAHLGGKFKRLKKAGYVPGGKDSGTVPEEVSEEEEWEEDDEEMVEDVSEEEADEYELHSKSQKKGYRQAQRTSTRPRRGVQRIDKSYKPPSLRERKRFDAEAIAALNAQGIDSDDDDGNDQETLSRRLLEKQFEPSPLEVAYMTARDERLRLTDIPERLQILEEAAAALPSSDLGLIHVAQWIFDRAFGNLCVPSCPEFQHLLSGEKFDIVGQIAFVLHLVHNDKFEVPFIGMYRREECLDLLKEPTDQFSSFEERPTILQYKALWAVQEWNKKWLLLQRRKSALEADLKERIPVDASSIPEKDKIVQNIFRFLGEAESEQAVDNCEAQFNLHFPIDELKVADCGFKRPRFRSLYSIAHQAGLGKITKCFGLTSEAFGDNVKAGFKRNVVSDEIFLPDDLAAKFFTENILNAEFRDSASLIRGARHMLAMEISTEPLVRDYVRTFYSKYALVTTRPTPVGIDAIDALHQFEGVKWINDKLISAFDDEQWLLIQKAEEEKLIDVTVGLSKESIDNILFDFEQFFSSDGLSRTSQTWNEQRKHILQEAVVTHLLPIMEKEARMSLVVRAKQVLVAKCGLQLWNKVSIAPPKAGNLDCRNEDGPALRVLACCWGPFKTGTTFVMLDADGEILNIMHSAYLNIRAITPEQAQRKEDDQARLMRVLLDYKPHVIVLGAAKVQCRYLSQDISDVLFKVIEQHAGELAEGLESTKLVYGDESIPALFEASKISQSQLPGQPGAVRRAVALGRFLQNPVALVASLCRPPLETMEVLSIKFHPLQSFLSKEELYDIIERVMITVVNQVGIDINLAVMHDWLLETLQFVAGLGPRKAEDIRRTLQVAGRVLTRNDFLYTLRAMDNKVFTNSAGFFRVRMIGQTSSDLHPLEPLDNTRIHHEWYQMAKNLAEAAIAKEAKRNNEVDDDVQNMAVEYVIKNPNVLDSVDIEEYAQSIQVEGRSKLTKTLELIKSELQRGFQEWRKPYLEPSPEECFYLMTGESKETLFEGRIVQATVRKVQEHQVMCVLECGLLGFIQKEDLSDDGDIEPKDKFTEGSLVTCRVKEVKIDKYLVDLTCKESDLRGGSWEDPQHRDKHYKADTTFLVNEREKARQRKEDLKKMTFKLRPIVHPKFQNLSTDDAVKVLAEKDMGDFIIHPSSKGPANLSITLKLHDGLFFHIDIAEGGKENWDLVSFLRLGKTLTIGDDYVYKDLDEVISKHVNQIVIHLHSLVQYRKYKQGNKSEIVDALRSEKAEKPKVIPYCISIAHEYPGAFMLSYLRATNPYHEYISLVPSGFRFRKKLFDSIDNLVVYFQSHFRDPVPEPFNRGRGGRGRGEGGRGRGRGDRDNGEKGVCYAFQRGECDSGDGCKFLHEKQDERPRGVCYSFQRGSCENGDDCKFLHDKQDERPRGVCYSFQRGSCENGDDCKFLHEKQDERPRGVCYSFQRGSCENGDDCKFLHEKQDERPRGVCYSFQRGSCENGDDCKFLHDKQDERPRGVCYGFQRGACENGDDCKFLHEKQDERPRGVCYGFQRGACDKGDDCKFLHEKQDGPEVCRAFRRGDCSRGDSCRFLHENQDERPPEVCRAFRRGDCSRGDSCRFLHEKQDERPLEVCRAFRRGDCSRGDNCRYAHDEEKNTSTGGGNAGRKPEQRMNTSTTNSNGRAHDWSNDTENDNWGDNRGTASYSKGGNGWNDAADGGGGSAWGDKGGIASNTEGKADGLKDAADGGGGSAWGDEGGIASNTEGEADGWKDSINAAGGGGWGIEGESVKAQGEDATKISGGGNAWDGWGSVAVSGDGWDDVEAGHDNVSGIRSGDSDKRRWNENAGDVGEKGKRGGSDLCPAKRPAHNSWGNRESTRVVDGVDSTQDRRPPSNTATTNDAWGSVTNSSCLKQAADGDDAWDSAPASESGGWDDVQSGDKGVFNSQTGRDGLDNSRGRDQAVARRQEGSRSLGSGLPPVGPSSIPIQDSWGNQSEPPVAIDDGWGQLAEKRPDTIVVSGGDSGWGEQVNTETELAGPDWGAVEAVVDPWGSGGGWGQQGNDDGSNRQSSQRYQGHSGSRGGRGSQSDGGRWGDRGGRGSRDDGGRWEGRGGRRGGRGDRWEDRGGRGSQNNNIHSSSNWD